MVPSEQAPDAEPGAWILVWAGWVIMTALTLTLVAFCGPKLPIWDDFDVVDVLAGARRLTIEWLWSFHNEHRVPLPRLILLILLRLSGNDFRAGMFFNGAALAILAGAAVIVAGRRPGGSRTYDLLFPLILLNPANTTNLLWSWQLQFVLSTVIAGAFILLIVSCPAWPGPLFAAAGGVCLVALTLCGANGVALVPAFVCWLLAASLAHRVSGSLRVRFSAFAVMAAAVPGIVLAILYFSDYHGYAPHPTSTALTPALRTSLQFISLMFGTEARRLWPASGLTALIAVGATVLILVRAIMIAPARERSRAFGLLCARRHGFARAGDWLGARWVW